MKYSRCKYDTSEINVYHIYPKAWFPLVIIVELFWSSFLVYNYKVVENYQMTLICMGLFYVVAIGEFILRFLIKDKYYKKDYCMEYNAAHYHKMIKILIIANIGVAIVCLVHVLFYVAMHLGENYVHEKYWIWYALVLFLICMEPFNDMTTGFSETYFLKDRYILDYSEISEIRIVNKKYSIKGSVYEFEAYKGDKKVGEDKVLEEDLMKLRKIVNGNAVVTRM